jgi:hypothetical protein
MGLLKSLTRPFRDVHNAVKKVGGGVNKAAKAVVTRPIKDVKKVGRFLGGGSKKPSSPKFGMHVIAFLLLSSGIAFGQANPGTLAEATGYTYRYYPNAVTTGTVLTGVTCTGTTAPFNCSAPYPAFTPGSHTLQLTAANIAGESVKSPVFSFTFVVVPGNPINIRIQ